MIAIFVFREIEEREKKELEKRINELDNQVRHWKSMYEREVKKRPVVVRYTNENQDKERIKGLLELHYKSKNKKYKDMIIEEMYVMFGVIKRPTHELLKWWRQQ